MIWLPLLSRSSYIGRETAVMAPGLYIEVTVRSMAESLPSVKMFYPSKVINTGMNSLSH